LGSITAIINAFSDLLSFDWPIPFVSELYQFVTQSQDPLTPLDLIALILAVPTTIFYKLTHGVSPFPDNQSVEAFEQQFTAQAVLAMLPPVNATDERLAVAADPRAAARPQFSPAGLSMLYALNLIADLAYGGLSAGADIQKVNPVPQKATSFEFGVSIACLITEGVVFFTAAPGWSNTPPTRMAWIVWGLGATGIGVDTTMCIARKKITQLNEDFGVIMSFIVGLETAALYAIWAATEGCPPLVLAAGIVGAGPALFKLLRLNLIEQLMIGPVPVKPWNRIGLTIIDIFGALLSGLFGFIANAQANQGSPDTLDLA
jgi:hypothetical protein